jgi:serpin B
MFGCVARIRANNLMDDITPNKVNEPEGMEIQNSDLADFAVRLFKASEENGKNTLISPLSVLCALAMTANGAKGETRAQMESVLGMSAEELNFYIYSYMKNLPQGEKYKLSLANSIWFTDDERFTVNQDFLQTNADYYGADIFKAPFNKQTCKDINTWVKNKTDGMIPEILDEIPAEAIMYLVNALAFDAEWAEIYKETAVNDGIFTKEDGAKQSVTFMYGEESRYLEDEKATGFIKYYKDGKYAFVALLPNEGVSVSEYVASLDGESLSKMLGSAEIVPVNTCIPKFETEYEVEMSEILKEMGMPDAFDSDKADFTGLGTSSVGNIYISRVIHKTFISVDEKGTKAGAATAVEVAPGAAPPAEEPKSVILDRPFLYFIVDTRLGLPVFAGAMNAP